MHPFMGNPCMHGHCMREDCENCSAWTPCIYYGKKNKYIKLPKWKWLVTFLYQIEHLLIKNYGKGTF